MSKEAEIMLARLILRLKGWSFELFSEGDNSVQMDELVEWAKDTLEEGENG